MSENNLTPFTEEEIQKLEASFVAYPPQLDNIYEKYAAKLLLNIKELQEKLDKDVDYNKMQALRQNVQELTNKCNALMIENNSISAKLINKTNLFNINAENYTRIIDEQEMTLKEYYENLATLRLKIQNMDKQGFLKRLISKFKKNSGGKNV